MEFEQEFWQIDGWQASSDPMAQEPQAVWLIDLFQAGEYKLVLFLASSSSSVCGERERPRD